MAVNTWRIDIADSTWVGAIETNALLNGVPQPVTSGVQFAVVPKYARPADTDWTDPVPDPFGTSDYGVSVTPVTAYTEYGVWARYVVGDSRITCEPRQVGYITRTTK